MIPDSATERFPSRAIPGANWFLAAVAAGAALLAWIASVPQWGGPGLTWDEAYYYPTFLDVREWVGTVASDPRAALSGEALFGGWQRIHELPPVVKWLGAAALTFAPESGWGRLAAMRLVPAAAYGITLALVMAVAGRCAGRGAAVIAGVLYAALPRVFGHAQIAATESVFACVTILVAWIAMHDLSRWRWRIPLLLAVGLALATKVNGIILVAVLMAWLLSREVLAGKSSYRLLGRMGRDALLAAGIVAFAPVVAWLVWPWLWHDTAARVAEYIAFIREHSHQGLWFLGRKWNYGAPLAPMTYPIVMAHLVVPVLILALFYAALGSHVARAIRSRRIAPHTLLLVFLSLAPIAAASLPGTPRYDGERLFFPLFAPAAALAGVGLRRLLPRRALPRTPAWLLVAVAVVALQALALRPTVDSYNLIAKMIGRADSVFPFEQTYWGNALDAKAIADLNQRIPPNGRVLIRSLQGDTFAILQSWGVLREDIAFVGDQPCDAHLIQNRRGFWGNADWTIFQEREPTAGYGGGVGGEPLIFLYDGRPPGG